MEVKEQIVRGKTALGIELGSTRIKAVLVDNCGKVLAAGIHDWENSLINNIWTYSLDEIHQGIRACYSSLRRDVEEKYGAALTDIGAIGISAMMHGYMALDDGGNQLAPFQTWRNTNTQQAADELTELFQFNIPLRWTIAHLYQRILDGEQHVEKAAFVTTLSSYIHWKLTGQKVIGIGDAAGIFPIDSERLDYDAGMLEKFNHLIEKYHYSWKAQDVLPKVLTAGEAAGTLTEEGAAFLDESGQLKPGIALCPPEGDAGTGMVATPAGYPCAMSHANNGTSDLNAWVSLFGEFAQLMGIPADPGSLFEKLYTNSLQGDPDCGGLLAYGYYSGENITMLNEGRPVFLRTPESRFNLANFMKAHLYTSLGAVKMGLDILMKEEKVEVERITGHGGFFKTRGVGQRYLAAAVHAPVTVMDTASEGGAWGIALLALYLVERAQGETLEAFLEKRIFSGMSGMTITPEAEEIEGFEKFMEHYRTGLAVEKAAIASMKW